MTVWQRYQSLFILLGVILAIILVVLLIALISAKTITLSFPATPTPTITAAQ